MDFKILCCITAVSPQTPLDRHTLVTSEIISISSIIYVCYHAAWMLPAPLLHVKRAFTVTWPPSQAPSRRSRRSRSRWSAAAAAAAPGLNTAAAAANFSGASRSRRSRRRRVSIPCPLCRRCSGHQCACPAQMR